MIVVTPVDFTDTKILVILVLPLNQNSAIKIHLFLRRPHRRKNPDEIIRRDDNGLPFGNKTVFTPEQEKGFVKYLEAMKILRLPKTKKQFEVDVQFLSKYFSIPNPFKDDKPGMGNIFRLLLLPVVFSFFAFMKDINISCRVLLDYALYEGQ